jgi:D-alanyl-D-alanine carboxypeptidase/D-alanyl-D-alanine-endopeptidase (penicillin-binding protein 4)
MRDARTRGARRGRLAGAAALAASCAATIAACAAAPRPAAPPAPARDARTAFAAAADSLLADTLWRNAHWGVLVVDPGTGDTLYSRNAGKLFMPASNQKIVTGATALALLGPDYRWRTALVADRGALGPDGTLRGDLRVVGRGDPTVSDHAQTDALRPLRALADTLRARGVRRVDGRLVAAGAAFPGDPLGFGWAWDDLDEPYSAGVAELLFNEGFARVVVRGGDRPGAATVVAVAPAPSALPVDAAGLVTGPPGAPPSAPAAARPRASRRAGTPRAAATCCRARWARATARRSPSPSATRAPATSPRSATRCASAGSPCRAPRPTPRAAARRCARSPRPAAPTTPSPC